MKPDLAGKHYSKPVRKRVRKARRKTIQRQQRLSRRGNR